MQVHVECYGLEPTFSSTEWRCDPCRHTAPFPSNPTAVALYSSSSSSSSASAWSPMAVDDATAASLPPPPPSAKTTTCVLCSDMGGAMKPTTVAGKWVHVSCALWVPEVVIHDPVKLTGIDVSGTKTARNEMTCVVCQRSHRGRSCLQCHTKNCRRAFHPRCARNANFRLVISHPDSRDDDDDGGVMMIGYTHDAFVLIYMCVSVCLFACRRFVFVVVAIVVVVVLVVFIIAVRVPCFANVKPNSIV
jgi:hypothetical protein